MLFKALSAAVYGIDANLIDVEVDLSLSLIHICPPYVLPC